MRTRRKHRGFTLLELVLVMLILVILAALAVPKITGFRQGATLRNSADEFVAATRFARTQAVSSGMICCVQIDKQSGTFVVKQQSGQNWVNVDGEFGQPMSILDGGTIDGADMILFYPTGRVQPAQVKITPPEGNPMTIACTTPAEDFAVVTQ